MARLPTLDDLGPRPAPTPQTSIASVDMGAPDRALAGAGEAVTAIGDHLNEARRATQLTDALANASLALGQKEIEFQRDPDYTTASSRFGDVAKSIGDNATQTISDPLTRRVFQQEYTKLAVAKQLGVAQIAAKQEQDSNVGKLEDTLQTFAQQAAVSKTDLERNIVVNQARIAIGETRAAKWITDAKAFDLQQRFQRTFEEATVTRDLGDDPVTTLKRLKTDPQYGVNIDPVVRARMVHWAQAAAIPMEVKGAADRVMSAPQPAAAAAATPDESQPRGIRNNNPGNIRKTGNATFEGQVEGSDNLYATFESPEAGIRAIGKNVLAYNDKYGLNTVQGIVSRWAPPSENNTSSYVQAVSNALGVSPDQRIDVRDPAVLSGLTRAIVQQENGAQPFSNDQFVEGVSAALQGRPANAAPTKAHDTRAMLPQWLSGAEQEAQRLHPNDAVFREHLITEVKGRVATITAAQQAVQTQAHDTLLTRLAGMDSGKPDVKPTTMSELLATPQAQQAWSLIDGPSRAGIVRHVQMNAQEAEGKPAQINARLVQDLFTRIYLPPDDPTAITQPTQLTPYISKGLTPQGHATLVGELQKLKNPEGRDFQTDAQHARQVARLMLTRSMIGSMQPDVAEEAAFRWSNELSTKIDAYRKAGKDPRDLITPGTPDYMLDAKRVSSFLPAMKSAVSSAAASGNATAQYEVGKPYSFKQGTFKYRGGDPNAPTSWEAVK